jgi:hypothetical protein
MRTTVEEERAMVTPTSLGDWAQAIAMGGMLAAATWWFARALQERAAPDTEYHRQRDEARELVGAGSGDATRR